MFSFLVRRVAFIIPILIGVSLIVFGTVKMVPGDPVSAMLGPSATPEARESLTEHLGLDKALPVQYVVWLGNAVQGDLGRSISRQVEVTSLVWDAMKNTLLLTGFAMFLALVLGIGLGSIAVYRRGKLSSRAASLISIFGISAPQYTLGLIFVVVFALELGLFPPGGIRDPSGDGGPVDLLRHILLPGVAAALVPAGIIARLFASSMLDVMGEDFVEALRARGLRQRAVMKHVVWNTMPPLLTIAGLQLGYLLGGVIFVETIFNWPGIGMLVFQSVTQRDLPVIQGAVLFSAGLFVLLNLAVDILHRVIDPRLGFER